MMVSKSAFTIALYSLAIGGGALAFSPAIRSLPPAVTITTLATISTSTALCSAISSNHDTNEPQLQRKPLPPIPSLTSPSILQKLRLKLGYGKSLRERVVHKYFHGVDTQNIPQIAECFCPTNGAIIRDVCALTNTNKSYDELGSTMVTAKFLGERCQEFLEAHPDCEVKFHYGPTCGRGRNNNWVYAHWYEEGSWSGPSQGIEPDGSPLTVQGQTRFWIDNDLKIKEIVITRTFSSWEETLLLKGKESKG